MLLGLSGREGGVKIPLPGYLAPTHFHVYEILKKSSSVSKKELVEFLNMTALFYQSM